MTSKGNSCNWITCREPIEVLLVFGCYTCMFDEKFCRYHAQWFFSVKRICGCGDNIQGWVAWTVKTGKQFYHPSEKLDFKLEYLRLLFPGEWIAVTPEDDFLNHDPLLAVLYGKMKKTTASRYNVIRI